MTQQLHDYPRKLTFFGEPSEQQSLLESKLLDATELEYAIKRFDSLKKLKSIELPQFCHAVILEIRGAVALEQEVIRWVGELQSPVALICLCRDFRQMLEQHQDDLHLIDEIVVPEALRPDEFAVRLSHAIRKCRAEQELLQDQELLTTLMDHVPDSIYFKDRDCRFIRVNAAKAKKHQQRAETMIGQSDFDYFTEERARPAYEEEQRIMRSGEPVLGEIQKLTFEDGRVGWVNTSKLPLQDKFGRVVGTMGISRDITAQKEGERDQDLLNELLDNIPDAIYFKDKKSRFIRVNRSMAEKYGQRLESLVGKSDFDLFTEEHARSSFNDERVIMSTGKPIIGKIEKETLEDGRTHWVNTTKVPLHDKSGEIIGTMGISRDVTEQTDNELQLKAAREKLNGNP